MFLRDKPGKGRLVVSVNLLQTSVAVEVDSASWKPSRITIALSHDSLYQRLLVVCVLAPVSHGERASKLTLVPSASVSSVYDDNIFAKAVGSADQMMLITPALETTYETPVTMLFGSYTFDVQRSLANPTLSTLHARRHATVDSKFQMTPRFTFGLGGRYDRTDGAAEFQRFTGVLLNRRRAERWEAVRLQLKLSSRTTSTASSTGSTRRWRTALAAPSRWPGWA